MNRNPDDFQFNMCKRLHYNRNITAERYKRYIYVMTYYIEIKIS